MIITKLPLAGALLIDPEPIEDERGFFARVWDGEILAADGCRTEIRQCSTSYNRDKGTVRGLHGQGEPHPECKIVRCIRGAIFDVIVDARPESVTYGRWHGVELSADNRRAVYIPAGFAHGFQTLADDSEVFYMMTTPYHPESQYGFRYDDPAIGIDWPLPVTSVSERDQGFPPLKR